MRTHPILHALVLMLSIPIASAQPTDPPVAALLAKLMLAQELEIGYHLVDLAKVEGRSWPDACLGVATEGRACAQVVTPGYLIVLSADGEHYSYRSDRSGLTIVQVPPSGEEADLAPLELDGLEAGAEIAGPLFLTGSAPGSWYFEAKFQVRLLDADGNEIAAVAATAQGEWMTEEQVPFRAELHFGVDAQQAATLVLERANPSGLPQNAAERRVPLTLLPGD